MTESDGLYSSWSSYDNLPVVGGIKAYGPDEFRWGVAGNEIRLRGDSGVSRPNLYSSLILDAAVDTDAELAIDLGCGSGALGIGLAVAQDRVAAVYCLDIDPAAVALTWENARINGVSDRIKPIKSDWLEAAGDVGHCGLIISSPPHTPCSPEIYSDVEAIDPSLARSSFGGRDGLKHIGTILGEARSKCPDASIVMALGSYVIPGLYELAGSSGYRCEQISRVVVQMSAMAERVSSHVCSELNYIFPLIDGRPASEITVVRLEPDA